MADDAWGDLPTERHAEMAASAARWASSDERVRALLLKGSLGRGEGDGRSDLDLVVVCAAGALAQVWAERRAIAGGLGECLGSFDEAPWQAPHTYIALYDGPVKVDLFFQEGEPEADPCLRDGFRVLVDEDGLGRQLREALAGEAVGEPDLSELDAHAWDWIWWLDVKLARGRDPWLVHVELVKFVETILVAGHVALTPEPWRGLSGVAELPAGVRAALARCLPRAPADDELRRSLAAAVDEWGTLRVRLAHERQMPLREELARQVRSNLAVAG